MRSSIFNEAGRTEWPLFTTVELVRERFPSGTSILVAIGGWGETQGFSVAAATVVSRRLFAKNILAMIDSTGADGKPQYPHHRFLPADILLRRCGLRLGVSWVSTISCH